MSAREKIAYLRGLIEGQNVAENASMTKFHEALLGALDSIAEEIDDLSDLCEEMRGYIEDLEDELVELREEEDAYADECGCGCGHHHHHHDDEEEYEAATCPHCGKDFFYQPDAYDDEEDLLCPHCGEPFKQ